MEILKRWTTLSAAAKETDPSHFYGDSGSVAFIYDNDLVLYAKKHKDSKSGVFKNGKFISDIKGDPGTIIHSDIAEVFPTEAGKLSKAWYRVTHGRVSSSKKEINFMMPFSSADEKNQEAEVKKIVRALKKYNLLKSSGPYKVGVFKETEWLFYKVEKDDLTGRTKGLSTHDIMRDRIYNRIGLESKIVDFINLLKEELKC